MNLKLSSWQYFDYIRIFDIKKGFYNKKPDPSGSGKINFIGATDHNNGVTERYTLDEIENASRTGDLPNESLSRKVFPAHAVCVTNNGSVGYAYYQEESFTCSHDVNPLYLKDGEFNKYTGLFVATVIMHDKYRWGYGRKWRPERMVKSKIKLPIVQDEDGNPLIDGSKKYSDDGYLPDWVFMEKYMMNLSVNPVSTNNKSPVCSFNTKDWKEFQFGKLIENNNIYKAKAYSKIELETKNIAEKGYIHFVSRTEENNSIDCYAMKSDFSDIEKGNAITVGDTTSTIAYQSEPFVNGDHIIVIRADWLNKYTGMFIVSLLRKERYRYSYGRAFLMDSIKNTKLHLPVKKRDGKPIIDDSHTFSDEGYLPDWEWMETYIKSLPYSDRI